MRCRASNVGAPAQCPAPDATRGDFSCDRVRSGDCCIVSYCFVYSVRRNEKNNFAIEKQTFESIKKGIPKGVVLNVNFPKLKESEIIKVFNNIKSLKPTPIDVFKEEKIDMNALYETKLINKSIKKVKVFRDTEECTKIALKGIAVSSSVRALIEKSGGSIGFDQYMNSVLYQPDLGYYSSNIQKFGFTGDFITAPIVSPLFSKCLAYQCSQVLDEIKDSAILEIGAGNGVMAKDLLLELQEQDSLPNKYYIFEVSLSLEKAQKKLLILLDQKKFHLVNL